MSVPKTGTRSLEAVPPTDADLVIRVIHGERNAYAGLVRRHQQTLYRYVRGMGLDHDTSLDLVQDAFVKAYLRMDECRDPAHFRAWLFSIGRNLCLDHLKNVRRLSVPLSMIPGAERIPSSEAAQSELKRTLGEALDTLPPDLRDAFLLKHHAGYTYEEVAEIAAVSASAVKMRVHRARETLRAFLTERGVSPVTIASAPIVLANEQHENDPAERRDEESTRWNKGGSMASKLLLLMTLGLVFPPAALAEQAQAQARTPQARIDAAMEAAARADVPVSLLTSKVAEGEAKHVPRERIAAAVETRLAALTRASRMLRRAEVQAQSPGELALMADALEAGVSENVAVRTWRSAPSERRAVAIAVLADLVRLGQGSESAFQRVNAALRTNAALANLQAEVASRTQITGTTSTK